MGCGVRKGGRDRDFYAGEDIFIFGFRVVLVGFFLVEVLGLLDWLWRFYGFCRDKRDE